MYFLKTFSKRARRQGPVFPAGISYRGFGDGRVNAFPVDREGKAGVANTRILSDCRQAL